LVVNLVVKMAEIKNSSMISAKVVDPTSNTPN